MAQQNKIRIKIFKEEDRIQVAGILIKNGYTVRSGKCKRTETGKVYDYFLEVCESTDTATGGDSDG